jgi:hypothetical protein
LNWACSENLGGCFVETSAKNNLGVKDTFSLLLEQFLRKRHEQKGDDARNIKNVWSYFFNLFPKIFNLQEWMFVCNWVNKHKRLCLSYIQLSHGWEWNIGKQSQPNCMYF